MLERGLSQLDAGEGGLEMTQEKTPNLQGPRELKEWFGPMEGKDIG
jgi:hypothetical protein